MILYQLILSHLIFDYGKALTPEMIKAKSKGYPYIQLLNMLCYMQLEYHLF